MLYLYDIVFKLIILFWMTGLTTQWTYDDQKKWPGACQSGLLQSPIKLYTRDAVVDKYNVHIRGPLQLDNYENVPMSAQNNGHTLKWTVSDTESVPTLSGGPLRSDYDLLQFHLHWLSEHAIDGYKYPLEIHLVHMKKGLAKEEALRMRDGLAVVAILCQVSNEPDSKKALEELMPAIETLLENKSEAIPAKDIDVSRLLSPNMESYFTYSGSLTTPGCQEAVTWIVMDHPIVISDEQYKSITNSKIDSKHNYRKLQPSDRVVYHSASCTTMVSPNMQNVLGSVITALYCTSAIVGKIISKTLCGIISFKKILFSVHVPIKLCS